ncbi:conserved hypothetical protein [delta proteobacterium NaphS2]|nr:conserved hypothetical protein [delta proteobacterium NaphS2]
MKGGIMEKKPKNSENTFPPYSLSVKGASEHFGFSPQTIYNWMYKGRLHRGIHYLNIGNKPVIIREAFIEFLKKEDGSVGQS